MMAIVGEVLVRALIHGPAWASSPSIRTPISDQIHCSRGSKTSTYHVWAASRMTAGCCPTSPSKFLIIVFTLTSVPSPPDTLARDNPPGKGAATERHAHRSPSPRTFEATRLAHGRPGEIRGGVGIGRLTNTPWWRPRRP